MTSVLRAALTTPSVITVSSLSRRTRSICRKSLRSSRKFPPVILAMLKTATDQASQKEMQASNAMLGTLREMDDRVHRLATEKRMPIRRNPFSLKVVESWAASIVCEKRFNDEFCSST